MSQIPVAVDGSCNGLQHYAALALDKPGGLAVNVLPSDRPQVYCILLYHTDHVHKANNGSFDKPPTGSWKIISSMSANGQYHCN